LILLYSDDYIGEGRVVLAGRRADHVREVHRAAPGDTLRVGLMNGKMGTGVVMNVTADRIEMDVTLTQAPPAPLPVTLLLAMPRPKGFRRIIQCATTMGVKRIALFGAYRVEKSYWKSPWLAPDELRRQMVLGVEQARDTVLPEITLHPLFKPFMEDDVDALARGARRLVAHPGAEECYPASLTGPLALAIGPEGGFTDYELAMLVEHGFERVTLGDRILRTEQVVPVLLGRVNFG